MNNSELNKLIMTRSFIENKMLLYLNSSSKSCIDKDYIEMLTIILNLLEKEIKLYEH